MFNTFRIYLQYFAQSLKARMAYSGDFFALVTASVLVNASGLLFILFLMDGQTISSIGGWSQPEVLFIYGFSSISTSLFSIISPNLFNFGDRYVIQGQYDRVLLRPISSLSQVLFESFNIESIGSLAVGIATLWYSSSKLQISFGFADYLWLVISTVSGAIIILSIFIGLASLSFHFEDKVGLSPPVFNLMMFSRYPLPIYNNFVQFLLSWVLPFAFAGFYPASFFLSRGGFEYFCYATPAVAAICLILANILWRIGEGKYASTGN